jgi:hypothetical protein
MYKRRNKKTVIVVLTIYMWGVELDQETKKMSTTCKCTREYLDQHPAIVIESDEFWFETCDCGCGQTPAYIRDLRDGVKSTSAPIDYKDSAAAYGDGHE